MGSAGVAPSTPYFEIVSILAGLAPYHFSYIISCELTVLPEVADRWEVRTREALHESFTGRMQRLFTLRARAALTVRKLESRFFPQPYPPPHLLLVPPQPIAFTAEVESLLLTGRVEVPNNVDKGTLDDGYG